MLRGYRGIIAALGLILSEPSYGQNSETDQPPAKANSSAQHERIASVIEKQPMATAPDAGCDPGQDIRQSDLCAQWKAADSATESARWTFWTVVAGAIGVVLGFGTLLAAWRAAHWAKKAADHTEVGARAAIESLQETRHVNASQLRPYVFFSAPKSDLEAFSFEDGELTRAVIKNYGTIPAFKVVVSFGYRTVTLPIGEQKVDIAEIHTIGTLGPTAELPISINFVVPAASLAGLNNGALAIITKLRLEYEWPGNSDCEEIELYAVSEHVGQKSPGQRLTPELRRTI